MYSDVTHCAIVILLNNASYAKKKKKIMTTKTLHYVSLMEAGSTDRWLTEDVE